MNALQKNQRSFSLFRLLNPKEFSNLHFGAKILKALENDQKTLNFELVLSSSAAMFYFHQNCEVFLSPINWESLVTGQENVWTEFSGRGLKSWAQIPLRPIFYSYF